MDESKPIEFPPEVRELLDAAVLALWDPARPAPDLSPISEWLEVDGWDYVVNGIVGPYRYLSELADYLDDDYLLDCTDIEKHSLIKNPDRIEFGRSVIASRLDDCMDSIHFIPVDSLSMPPAALCMMMYYHPQGGAEFSDLVLCHSIEDYLESLKGDIVMNADDLSDGDILGLWRKAKPVRVKKMKS